MKITLYDFNGENIEIEKYNNFIASLDRNDCTLRQPTDMIRPVILLDFNENDTNILWNYCYIDATKRYYFITNKIRLSKKLWELHLEVDVLYTYKNEILSNKAFIIRNENNYNDFIHDDMYPVTKQKNITVVEIQNVKNSNVNTEFNLEVTRDLHNVVIAEFSANANAETLPPPFNSNILPGYNFRNSTYFTKYWVTWQANSALQSYINDNAVSSFIKAITVYPCDIPHKNDVESIIINNVTKELQPRGYEAKYAATYYMILADFIFEGQFNDYRDYEPYTSYELWIPYVGYVQLNPHDILNQRLALIYIPNYEDGSASVMLYNQVEDYIIYQNVCQLGVDVGVSSTNIREYRANQISMAANIFSGVTSASVSMASGNLPGVVAVGGRMVSNTISAAVQNYIKGNAVASSGISSSLNPMKPHFKIISAAQVEPYNSDFLHLYGRPLNEIKLLNDVHGYTLIEDAHLKSISGATKYEIDRILQLLKNGVILNQ